MSIRTKNRIDNTPPTKRQMELLHYIVSEMEKNGYAPSIPELSKRFKRSLSSVWEMLERLKRKDFLMKWKYAWRGIDIPDEWDKREYIKKIFGTYEEKPLIKEKPKWWRKLLKLFKE